MSFKLQQLQENITGFGYVEPSFLGKHDFMSLGSFSQTGNSE